MEYLTSRKKMYHHKILFSVYYIFVLPVFSNWVQPAESIECSKDNSLKNTNIFPQVKLSRGETELNQTAFGNDIIFETGQNIKFQVECTHTQPIQWIFNADLITKGLSEDSSISRLVGNFSDERTYKYDAVYEITIPPEQNQQTVVVACQTVNHFCERRIILAYYDEQILKYVVKLLLKNEENISSVIDFDNEVSKSTRMNLSMSSNTTCPFILALYITQEYSLHHTWSIPGGVKNLFIIDTPQTFENVFRFSPNLEEHCVDFRHISSWNDTICPECHDLHPELHEFSPLVFYYAVGDHERVFRVYFDLQRKLYFPWEKVVIEKLAEVSLEGPYYKGQEIPVSCLSSPIMFSFGSLITWSIEGENFTRGFGEETEELGVNDKGLFLAMGKIRTDKSFLDRSNIKALNISCIFPIWNSNGWVTSSKIIPLLHSKKPKILHRDPDSVFYSAENKYSIEEVMLNQNHTFKCEAEGIPLPKLEIIPPKSNLNFTSTTINSDNYTELIVTIPKFEDSYEGKYNCVATSVVGMDFKIFELELPKEFPFAKVVIICGTVICLVFIVISLGLIYKLRKEKQEFILLTEEAIRKFKEGFKNTTGIDFDSNSEYQDYEVPYTKWGIGGTMLGKGAFGVVQKGTVEVDENKLIVAVKTVNSPKDVADFENSLMELTIMSHIGRHEHVVSLVAACTDNIQKRSILIGVEYCANGDLLSYLQKRKDFFHSFVKDGKISIDWTEESVGSYTNVMNTANFSTVDLYRWSYQIANGMEFLESKKVLHADLAARNVLITHDKIAKISDFGLSRKLLDSNNYTKKTSSPLPWRWMALESLRFQQFSSKSDVWAFGITLYEIFSLGAEPWPGLGWTIEFVDELEKGRRLVRPNHGTENMYQTVMLECWRNEPEERITFANIKQFFENAILGLYNTRALPKNADAMPIIVTTCPDGQINAQDLYSDINEL